MEEIIVIADKNNQCLQVTLEQLSAVYIEQDTAILKKALSGLNKCLDDFKIGENKYEVAAFLAQVGHESALLRYKEENLNYSASALGKVFGKYFPSISMRNAYARNPEKIANRVYANRMGNGDENSGDGWRYRGRGYIQLTGKYNYSKFAEDMGMTLSDAIKYLQTIDGAWSSAGWYWKFAGLDKFDDSPSLFSKLTKMINGGYHGLQHREQLYNRALEVL